MNRAMIVKSSINMTGPISQANELRFGLGSSMAVQQDVEVVDWHLSFPNGAQSIWDALYFDPVKLGIVNVELSFVDIGMFPRSDPSTLVCMSMEFCQIQPKI